MDQTEEIKATHELIPTGLELIDKWISISDAAVNKWLHNKDDAPFPEADTFEYL